MFCPKCGKEVDDDVVICPSCGKQVKDTAAANGGTTTNTVVNVTTVAPEAAPSGKEKHKLTSILLCIFLGYLGAHRFYEGKIGTGILWLFTGGLGGIGVLVDLIILCTKKSTYYV